MACIGMLTDEWLPFGNTNDALLFMCYLEILDIVSYRTSNTYCHCHSP